jgi:hypothetical protein
LAQTITDIEIFLVLLFALSQKQICQKHLNKKRELEWQQQQ